MFKDIPTDRLFDVAQQTLEANPEAVHAVAEDVKDQWGVEVSDEITLGIMTCGIVCFLTIMQRIAQQKAKAN